MAAWIAQGLALAALLLVSRRDWQTGYGLYLFLETAHGALLWLAAWGYARGPVTRRRRLQLLAPIAIWAAVGPAVFADRSLLGAQLAVLAVTSLGAAVVLRPRRVPGMMGVRLTVWVLALLAAVYVFHASALVMVGGVVPPPYLELGPFNVLLLQTLLAFGMVLTAMEEAQRALHATNLQLMDAEHRLKTLAETDPLTGCFNRRVFRDLVDTLRSDGAARGVVVMLDMDGLKAINDAEGHGVGDAAIRAMADAIRSRTRNTDLAVRWGGDEFVVVIPGVSIAEGRTRQEELRQAIAQGGFSASAGAAAYGDGVDIMAAVDQADRAMYASREARRRA
jgi:diguanylate cyclase (GGDEF)-like protein